MGHGATCHRHRRGSQGTSAADARRQAQAITRAKVEPRIWHRRIGSGVLLGTNRIGADLLAAASVDLEHADDRIIAELTASDAATQIRQILLPPADGSISSAGRCGSNQRLIVDTSQDLPPG